MNGSSYMDTKTRSLYILYKFPLNLSFREEKEKKNKMAPLNGAEKLPAGHSAEEKCSIHGTPSLEGEIRNRTSLEVEILIRRKISQSFSAA